MMTLSGIAWGFYTLAGKGSNNPLADTTFNFIRTIPFVFILLVLSYKHINVNQTGVILAFLSGGLCSGIGYSIWYFALKELKNIQAATVQLFVPVIATFGGVIFSNEILSQRLMIASIMILGGVAFVVFAKRYHQK